MHQILSFFPYRLLESSHGLTTSQLFVESADQSNTGNYSCSSDAGHSNTTAIHVITGKMIYPLISVLLKMVGPKK